MKAIFIYSRRNALVFAPLYFMHEKDLLTTATDIISMAHWNDQDGEYKMVITGESKSVYYTDRITVKSFRIILGHIRTWRRARIMARRATGVYWWFGNEAFRRAATLRQMEKAKKEDISQ